MQSPRAAQVVQAICKAALQAATALRRIRNSGTCESVGALSNAAQEAGSTKGSVLSRRSQSSLRLSQIK
jgi:hypothetical protein